MDDQDKHVQYTLYSYIRLLRLCLAQSGVSNSLESLGWWKPLKLAPLAFWQRAAGGMLVVWAAIRDFWFCHCLWPLFDCCPLPRVVLLRWLLRLPLPLAVTSDGSHCWFVSAEYYKIARALGTQGNSHGFAGQGGRVTACVGHWQLVCDRKQRARSGPAPQAFPCRLSAQVCLT